MSAPRLLVRVASDAKVEQRVHVQLRFEGLKRGLDAASFKLTSKVATLADVEIGEDAKGWTAKYVVSFASPTEPLDPVAEPIELRALGRDLFPELDFKLPIELDLVTGELQTDAASSFGLGAHQKITKASFSDLRNGYFLAGGIGKADFHASDGHDYAGWAGFTAFDPRFVAAQTAGVRSAIDAWMGRQHSPTAMFFAPSKQRTTKVTVVPVTNGIAVAVDPRSSWTPTARILVAQALVQRYVGSALWVGDRKDESGWFFAGGFSRTIAREILYDVGVFDAVDRANELNMIFSSLAFATEPREISIARGALVATAAFPKLKTLIRELLEEGKNEIPREAFLAKLGPDAAGLTKDLDFPDTLGGPCFKLVKKQLVRFELGFVPSAGEEMTVESVKAGSKAEAAGLKVGDVVKELHYEEDRASVPVDVTLVRDKKPIKLRYQPSSPSKPGRWLDRLPNLPAEKCSY